MASGLDTMSPPDRVVEEVCQQPGLGLTGVTERAQAVIDVVGADFRHVRGEQRRAERAFEEHDAVSTEQQRSHHPIWTAPRRSE